MKFLCDNCKAKYQIADEKVAGKTVRMKCRKCGHQIEVRAAVTETSVASSPPQAPQAPRPRVGGLATSLSAQKPRPHSQPPGALAGAFQRQVEQAPTTQPFPQTGSVEVNVSDEWYVAINGVPVGPVRISELRRKAAGGAVTEDSLCWQEGLEEWRPIRSIPELATLVREAAQGNRPSLVTPPPPDAGRASSPPRPPTPPPPPARPPAAFGATAPLGATPPPPRPLGPAPMRSNVVPLRPDLEPAAAKAAPLGSAAAALSLSPSLSPAPAVAPPPPPRPMQTSDPFAVPARPAPDPFAIPPTPSPFAPPTTGISSSSSSIPLGPPPTTSFAPSMAAEPPKRGGVPLWFWAIIALFVPFGGVAAYAIFFRSQPPPQQIVVQVPATPTGPASSSVASNDVPPPDPSAAPSASATSGGRIATGPRQKPRPGESQPSGGGIDLSGLGGGGGGPVVGPGGGGGGSAGGGLDQNAVQQVVRNRSAGVKRTCWERGGNDQKSSANVQVTVTVAPNGQVSNASATGDDPVIAKCIEGQVRTWSFPAPGQTTTINIPFHFVRQ